MTARLLCTLTWFCAFACAGWVGAQETANSQSTDIQAELDAVREGLFELFNQGKYQELVEKYGHPSVVTTWPDGTSAEGHQGVLDEFEKLGKFIDKMQVSPKTDIRVFALNDQVVVVSGSLGDTYQLSTGQEVALDSRWSGTLIRHEDSWKLISFTVASNAFENEVIDLSLNMRAWTSGIVGALVGLLVGIIGVGFMRRSRSVS